MYVCIVQSIVMESDIGSRCFSKGSFYELTNCVKYDMVENDASIFDYSFAHHTYIERVRFGGIKTFNSHCEQPLIIPTGCERIS